MKLNKILTVVFAFVFLFSNVYAQRAEITISLNENFFDTFLDALYQNSSPPEFPLSQNNIQRKDAETQSNNIGGQSDASFLSASYSGIPRTEVNGVACTESIRILREMNGIRTAVRLREGKIYVPLAFSGSYSPPFVGCVDFAGWAETNVDLEFDQTGQRLIARTRVLNVSLNGTGGLGSGVITKMVQGAIDKKINPFEIIRLDKVSFVVPMQNSGNLKMRAVGIRHEIVNGALNVHIAYEFIKA